MVTRLIRGNFSLRNFFLVLIILIMGCLYISQKDDSYMFANYITMVPWKVNNMTQYRNVGEAANEHESGLIKKPRLLCLVLTFPANHDTKAKAIMDTWGRRCDYIYFITSETNTTYDLPLIYADCEDIYDNSFGKIMFGIKFAYENFMDKVDWVLRADDDSYVIIENVLQFLEDKDTNDNVYYGRTIKHYVEGGYHHGSLYLLSKKATQLLIEVAAKNSSLCKEGPGGFDDLEIGNCLGHVGTKKEEIYDETGDTIHLVNIFNAIFMKNDSWIYNALKHTPSVGFDCCSTRTMSFHYMTDEAIYTAEMLLYKIRVSKLKYKLEPHDLEAINALSHNHPPRSNSTKLKK